MEGVATQTVSGSDHLNYSVGIINNQMYCIPLPKDIDEVGIPWKPDRKEYKSTAVGLHEEIVDFLDYISPTAEEQFVREMVVARVREVVLSLWPDCKVDIFGSFKTGLYLPTSDIDMVIFGEWDALPLHTLKHALYKSGISSKITVLDKATVPIVKMTDRETNLRVDISFNMKNSVKAAELILSYMKTYPCLPYLVFVLKQYLRRRGLNEVWTGGLSSYALILMCVSFLQHTICPGVPIDNINLGVLLVEFFELYGRLFNYMNTAIRVTNGGCYVRKEVVQRNMDGNFRPSLFCIEDPLCPGNDVGRRSYCAHQVKRSFEHAYSVLSSAILPHYRIIHPENDTTVLGRIISIHKKSAEFRKNIMKYARRLHRSLIYRTLPPFKRPQSVYSAATWVSRCFINNMRRSCLEEDDRQDSSSAQLSITPGALEDLPPGVSLPLVWPPERIPIVPKFGKPFTVFLTDEDVASARKTPSVRSSGSCDDHVEVISSDSSGEEGFKANSNGGEAKDGESVKNNIPAVERASLTTVNQVGKKHISTVNKDSSGCSSRKPHQGRKRRCVRTQTPSQTNVSNSTKHTGAATSIKDDRTSMRETTFPGQGTTFQSRNHRKSNFQKPFGKVHQNALPNAMNSSRSQAVSTHPSDSNTNNFSCSSQAHKRHAASSRRTK
ncbi:unnamed protein product [Trichobilharzia szidati]|nr:unnamed protein product [Trichobilharzia szidati]